MGLHRERVRQQLILMGELPEENTDGVTPLSALLKKESAQRTQAALSSLPPIKRKALHLLKEEEKTYKEAAAELNLPVSTLEKQVAGTLKILRKKLTLFFNW